MVRMVGRPLQSFRPCTMCANTFEHLALAPVYVMDGSTGSVCSNTGSSLSSVFGAGWGKGVVGCAPRKGVRLPCLVWLLDDVLAPVAHGVHGL
jgi:hypothetical protein